MRTKLTMTLAGLGVMLAGTSLMGHHAFGGEFDPNRPVLLKGKVVKLEWVNPHAWIHVEVPKPEARTHASSRRMRNAKRGWSRAARRTRCSAAASRATR